MDVPAALAEALTSQLETVLSTIERLPNDELEALLAALRKMTDGSLAITIDDGGWTHRPEDRCLRAAVRLHSIVGAELEERYE